MNLQKLFISFIACLISMQYSFAQKKQLDHSVYDEWKSLSNISIDDNGRFSGTIIKPQEGDSKLFIQDLKKKKSYYHHRIEKYAISTDGNYTIGLLKAPFAATRQAKIEKKKPDEMPKDSLLIVNNETFNHTILPHVKSYKTSEKPGNYVAYLTAAEKDTTKQAIDSTENNRSKKKKEEKEKEVLVLYNLKTDQKDTLQNIKSYTFNKFGNAFAAIIEPDKKDSTDTPGVIFIDLTNYSKKRISNEKATYQSLSFDEAGEQLVYLATKDTSKVEQKAFDVRYYNHKADSALILTTAKTAKLPPKWIFTENSNPSFSKDGKRILLGAAPRQPAKDTTIVDFEVASLDLWHWKDPYLQPQQLFNLSSELKRTYTGIIELDKGNAFTLLANEEKPFCTVSDEGNGRYALLYSDIPYRLEAQWDLPKYDAWIYDVETKKTTPIATALSARPSLSAAGNFVYWFDSDEGNWFVYDNRTNHTLNITEGIAVNFWNEKNDVPGKPGSYGIAAWGKEDEYVLINDMFDIWKIDPKNKTKPQSITQQMGRKDSITFRYLNTDKEKRFVEPNDTLLLTAFDNTTKESGFYAYHPKEKKNNLKQLAMEKYQFSTVAKSKNNAVFVYQKANFNTSPDLYITKNWWKSSSKLTDINPQMREYKWGTPELFSWTSYAGVPLKGILYKPEGFDESKKYPVMIYFYEKHSDDLFRYREPAPSASTINIPFYSSRDYIVFTPDIHYTVGQPGENAYNAVVSGAEELAKNNWVDKENMAIQGQSWGGYQVAYLITKTDLFKAAGAGAPVSNMTSAYGGIRWESGRSRQYLYERGQSRLGVAMNDSLEAYIKNSPLFFANKVNTPLLIMHNDADGAVPWYQGIELFVSLRRLGKPVWMLQYNNEEHKLKERRNRKDLSIRLQQFFDHYLKGEPAPIWMTRGLPATQKGKDWGLEPDSKNNE